MISTSPRLVLRFIIIAVVILLTPLFLQAQGSVSLSVSPTLFEMSATEGQTWSSSVRVINTNNFPLKVYLNGVNFEPTGESGQGTMVPILEEETNGTTLAEWLDLPSEETIIPAEQTVSIPFTINVPPGAAPGGHFAAILVGTRSLTANDAPARVETSQMVSSLVFLRVAGDIIERGSIRDFVTERSIYESPQANFSIRFENAGNVHLQPQGNITIKNMWGKERGSIPINQTSQFGNVLPESVRNYTFEWTGDWSFADIGRYTAEVTLAYGDQARQFVTADTAFWVIPWRTLLVILVVFSGLIWLIVWGVKLYIRRMLQLAGITPQLQHTSGKPKRVASLTGPLEEGILDLRSELVNGEGSLVHRVLQVVRRYRLFLMVLSAVVVLVALFVWYLVLALSSDRGYEIRYEQNGEMVSMPEQSSDQNSTADTIDTSQSPPITVVNRSGIAGLDELRSEELGGKGYQVTIERPNIEVSEDRTVIVYDPLYADAAVALQQQFTGALLSSFESEDPTENPITIYLGSDQIQ